MDPIQQAEIERNLPDDLYRLFNHSSAIILIEGDRDSGKTDFSLKLAEYALLDGCVSSVATNIISEDPRLKHITNFPDLDYYLKFGSGRKLFILDEAGESLTNVRWMSTLAVKILGTCQLIRHFKGRLIFISPSQDFVLKYLQHPRLRDCKIEKRSRSIARVKNYLTKRAYNLYDIGATSIPFSQDPTTFTLEKPINLEKLEDWEKDLYDWGVSERSMKAIADDTGRFPPQVQRNLRKLAKHYFENRRT